MKTLIVVVMAGMIVLGGCTATQKGAGAGAVLGGGAGYAIGIIPVVEPAVRSSVTINIHVNDVTCADGVVNPFKVKCKC